MKLAAAMGAEVTVLSSSKGKEADAKRLGAAFFESSTERASQKKLKNRFNLIIDCVSADHSFETYLQMLAPFGALVLVGALSAHYAPYAGFFGLGAVTASFTFFTALGYGARLLAPVFARPASWVVLEVVVGGTMWAIAAGLLLRG